MAGVRNIQRGELIALPRFAEVRADADVDAVACVDLSNVIAFVPAAMRRAPTVRAGLNAARPAAAGLAHERLRLLAFAALSVAMHAGLFAAFWREPVPLASIGEQVISIEIVVGATAPAGVAQTPGEQDAATPETLQPEAPREPEEKATETPLEPEVASETPKPNEEPPRAVARDTEVALVPPPQEKPAEPKVQPPKPVQNAAPAKERRRIEAPTKEHATKQAKVSAPSTAANNVGVGRSDNNSNYAGLVSAHLRRHQQYPADARSRAEQGTATVSFSLDGGGRVTAAHLVRGSGSASIDQEVQAMVRRSSRFPAPPSGRGVSFTVPVSFRLN